MVQSSPEAPIVFSLLQRIFVAEPVAALRASAIAAGVSEDDFIVSIPLGELKKIMQFGLNGIQPQFACMHLCK